jgi:acyl-coenzyme A thioesterase PaaI-like protein
MVVPPVETDLETWFEQGKVLTPAFPNWERSFVSGPDSPLFRVEHREFADHPKLMITRSTFLDKAEGPPGHVHGGATAGLLDEVLGVAVWHAQFASLTQNLSLHYGRPLPLKGVAYALTTIRSVSDKTVLVETTIYDKEKTPYVCAQGAFHRLTPDQLQRFKAAGT